MSYAIVFSSKTGNTKIIGRHAARLSATGKLLLFWQPEPCRHGSGHPLCRLLDGQGKR